MSGQALIRHFLVDEAGVAAIEYGLIAAMMAVLVIAISATGGALDGIYNTIREIVRAIRGDPEAG